MLFGKRERTIRRILIVEDEPLVAFDTEHLLGEAGYEVVATVASFEDARAVIEEQSLDLVLSDIRLSGEGDGLDVARVAAAREIPVLFVSATCPIEARSLALGCLAKPYSERGLKAALDALDAVVNGETVKKVPAGLSLYERA
jgi:DNA-binding response OmpR family regulator